MILGYHRNSPEARIIMIDFVPTRMLQVLTPILIVLICHRIKQALLQAEILPVKQHTHISTWQRTDEDHKDSTDCKGSKKV